MGPTTDILLSYAWGPPSGGGAAGAAPLHPMQQRAHAIAAQLRAAGFSVWLDVERMPLDATGGGGTPEAMAMGVLNTSALVCVVSAEYARSESCRFEAQFAAKKRKPIFYVNAGSPGYDPGVYSLEEAATVSWLDAQIMNALWFDGRDEARLASEVDKLIGALVANGKVTRSGRAAVEGAPAAAAAAAAAAVVPAAAALAAAAAVAATADSRERLGDELVCACREARAADALRLIGEGALPDRRDASDGSRRTPLMLACENNSAALDAVVERLVAAGAALDLLDSYNGTTALLKACARGRAAAAALLLRSGAGALNAFDSEYTMTALDFAREKGAPLAAVAAEIVARGGRSFADL